MRCIVRPCFLVIDREFAGSISTRKLVIETAKFNVLTAYSGQEAMDLLIRFPSVSGAVLDGNIDDISANDLVRSMKQLQPGLPIVVIVTPGCADCPEADYQIESFDPAKLLVTLRGIKPDATAHIEKRNEELSREHS